MEYLKIDDFKNYNFLSGLKFSPCGKNSALIVKKASDKNDYYSAIFVCKDGNYYPLTNEKGRVSSFIWLDDENILFCETRDEKCKEKKEKGFEHRCYYKININGGEAKHEFCIDAEVSNIQLLSDGNFLISAIFDNNRPDILDKEPHEQERILKDLKKEKDYEVIEEVPFWFNGEGLIYKKRKRLYIYNTKDGLKPLTPPLGYVEDYKISPSKDFVLYSGWDEQKGVRDIKSKLYIIDLSNGKVDTLVNNPMFISSFDFWNDKVVLAAAFGENFDFHEHPTFYILDKQDKSLKELLKYDRAVGAAITSDCSLGSGCVDRVFKDDYYFISVDGYYADIYKLNLKTSNLENITNSKGSLQFFDIYDNSIYAVGFIDGKLQEVYSLEESNLKKRSSFNDDIYNSRKHPKIFHHVMKDQEGVEFDGWVLLPVDYDENKKYPAILDIHGGPKSAYGDIYFHEMQYWANLNYFVLFSNPRGSDGKGNFFADIRGKYGTIDYDNLMQFVDEMVEKYPAIDKDRLGVTGGSYGGVMTNWIIGHTDRFKAAATQRSISNFISFYTMSDIGYFFGECEVGANPWSNFEKIWWHSPLKYMDKVKTPTLVLHSDEDFRCPVTEAYQLFTALKLHNVETRLCVFHGENHELSRSGKPNHRERRLKEITDWMDSHLKDEKGN